MKRTWWVALACLSILLLGAAGGCGGGEGDDDDDDNDNLDTFAGIQSEVFALSCVFTTCHTGVNPAGSLSLADETASCNGLVSVPSSQVAKNLVEPSDASASFLIDKLNGVNLGPTQAMPPPSGGLEAAKIDAITDWVNNGAVCPDPS